MKVTVDYEQLTIGIKEIHEKLKHCREALQWLSEYCDEGTEGRKIAHAALAATEETQP